jgi:hypothetical protein
MGSLSVGGGAPNTATLRGDGAAGIARVTAKAVGFQQQGEVDVRIGT